MKRKLFAILIIFSICSISCRSNERKDNVTALTVNDAPIVQTSPHKSELGTVPADTINISKTAVKKAATSSVQLGASPTALAAVFGTPDSITTYYSEMDEKNETVYNYPGAKFYFLDGALDSYQLSNNDWLVGSAAIGSYIVVGASLSSVSAYLPNYATTKKQKSLGATITVNGQLMDIFLYIEFDQSTQAITSLSIETY